MNNLKRIAAFALAVSVILLAGCGNGQKKAAVANGWVSEEEIEGLEDIKGVTVYQDGAPLSEGEIDFTKDVKKLYISDKNVTIYDYANGYKVTIPSGFTPDYSLGRYMCYYESENAVIGVSVETAAENISSDDYFNSTILSKMTDDVKSLNKISFEAVARDQILPNRHVVDLFRGSKQDMADDFLANYSYVYMRYRMNSNTYYRFMIKYKTGFRYMNVEKMIKDSFEVIPMRGRPCNNADYEYPAVPNYWNEETKAYYNYLCSTDTTQWGLYNYQNYGGLQKENYFEKLTGTRADLVMSYCNLSTMDFDVEYATRAYEQDKVTVLTMRFQNAGQNGKAYAFDIVKGDWDAQIEATAKKIADFGHPMIIRMENEFNASWGVNANLTLGDAQWYKDAWIHIYNIFRNQGVRNAIFMSNPQSGRDKYNGARYMHTILYMPPKEYVQVIGLTQYDMGNEYSDIFSVMYEGVQFREYEFFGNWPWIIGEFGCGGTESGIDKSEWIREMFATVDRYPNIKGAIWFDSADSNPDGSLVHDFRLSAPTDAGITMFQCIKEAKAKSKTGEWSFKH